MCPVLPSFFVSFRCDFTIGFAIFFSRAGDSDVESSDLDKRKRKDKDGEASKSKKKHKKHKKNKKSKKHDVDGKERIKKHKKHHKRSKSSDGSDSNTECTTATKTRSDPPPSSLGRQTLETKLPPQPISTLNTKFTEIMKSNGHVAKVPLPKFNNGNGAEPSKHRDNVGKIPTDPSKLVEFITKSLDPNTSTQVVSSASESDAINDVDSPDVAVIEDDEDLNLEELMRQKALLQARLGGIPMSDTESENSHRTPASSVHKALGVDTKANEKEKEKESEREKEREKEKLKRRAEPVGDVILLDDSSNDASAEKPLPSPPKKKVRSSRSRSRDRVHKDRNSSSNSRSARDNRDARENDKSAKGRRSDTVENRFKEDLRKEIDRDKERVQRQSSSAKPGTYSPTSNRAKPPASEKSKMQSSFREREVNDDQKSNVDFLIDLKWPPRNFNAQNALAIVCETIK